MEVEENIDGKRKSASSIPVNYISIVQLQERWVNERGRNRKEDEEERRRKQRAEEHQRVEEDLKKAEAGRKREYTDEKRLDRKHWGGNSKKKESFGGGEAGRAVKEETAAIRRERGEDAAPGDEGLPEKTRGLRKRYDSRKKKKNQAVAVKEDFVDCGSIAPLIVTESNPPVKDAISVSIKKGEKEATGKKSVASREKAAADDATAVETESKDLSIKRRETKNLKAQTKSRNKRRGLLSQRVAVEEEAVECGTENHTPVKDWTRVYRKKGEKAAVTKNVEKAVKDDATAIETQFEDLSIKRGEERGETKNLKAQNRSSKPNRINQRHDLYPRRVRMPIGDATMVWVKKGQNEGAGDGIGNGV